MGDRTFDVVTLGEALLALRPSDDAPISAAERFVVGVVGSESNVAVALARLGHRVAFFGRVGDDAAGLRVLRALRAEDVDVVGLRTDHGAPTGLLVRDAGGPRGTGVDYHRACSAGSRLEPGDIDVAVIAAARMVFVTGLTCGLSGSAASAVATAVDAARRGGVSVCLDPNLRAKLGTSRDWEARVRPLLASVDVVMGSGTELQVITGTADIESATRELLARGVRTVVVRSDRQPTLVVESDGRLEVPFDRVVPVDSVGAGDAFAGGFLSGLLDGVSVTDALARAHAVARRCVLTMGDIEGLPTRAELARGVAEVTR